MNLDGIGKKEAIKKNNGKTIANTSIEDVMLAFELVTI